MRPRRKQPQQPRGIPGAGLEAIVETRCYQLFYYTEMSFKGSSGASGGIAARSNSTRTSKSTAKDEHNFKLVMVGDSGVGKSCLLEKFLDLSSNNAFISTIGVDVRSHVLKLDGHLIKLQVSLKLFVKS